MANNKHTTLMEVCVNPKLKQTKYKPLDDCVIGYDDKAYCEACKAEAKRLLGIE